MIKRVIKGTNLQIAPIVLGTADFGTAIDKDTAYAPVSYTHLDVYKRQ